MLRLCNATLVGLGAALLLSSSASAGPAPTTPGPDPDTVSVSVRFADLDLSRPEDAARLRRRVETAVTAVCGGQPDHRILADTIAYEHCRRPALEVALAELAAVVPPARGRMLGQ